MSTRARDVLLAFLFVSLLVYVVRAARPPPAVGPPRAATVCEVAVEVAGDGVGCVGQVLAERVGVVSGDLLSLVGGRIVRGRMTPARLAAWRIPIDPNCASADELASLDGIGPKLAARIVAARPFASAGELSRVKGIGARRSDRLRARMVISKRCRVSTN